MGKTVAIIIGIVVVAVILWKLFGRILLGILGGLGVGALLFLGG
jgi:hypothetical protein